MQGSPLNFNVFWRTFVLLALLLAGGIVAWVHTLRALDLEPRAVHEARQLASMVNLTRAALLQQTDGIARLALIKSFDKADSVQVRPREPHRPVGALRGRRLLSRRGPRTASDDRR